MATDMMGRICAHLNNWFCDDDDIRTGEWTVTGGALDLTGIVIPGQYFRIVGSVLNDGAYQYPAEGLSDETFTGEIWPMKVPRALKDLATEIAAWQEQYGAAMTGPYQSESVVGVYSYTRASGSGGTLGGADAWADVYRGQLNQWRRL